MYIIELVNLTNILIIVLILAFKLINNIVYLTTLHKNRADAQLNKIIISFNELIPDVNIFILYAIVISQLNIFSEFPNYLKGIFTSFVKGT